MIPRSNKPWFQGSGERREVVMKFARIYYWILSNIAVKNHQMEVWTNPNNVTNTTKLPFGDDIYNEFMELLGIIYWVCQVNL